MTSHENKAVFRRSETYHERKCQIWGPHSASLLQYIVIAKAAVAEYGFFNLDARITSETELNVTPNQPVATVQTKKIFWQLFCNLIKDDWGLYFNQLTKRLE